MTWEHVFLTLLALWNLYLSAVAVARGHRLSTQVAVLTLRTADLTETMDGLDTRIRTELER